MQAQIKASQLEAALERTRQKSKAHSVDILLFSVILLGGAMWYVTSNLLCGLGTAAAMVGINYMQYTVAYRDGFRGGYLTAMQDAEDTGFVPERMTE